MTPILTVLKTGGEYTERHVEWLQRQIGREIFCLTDSAVPMECVVTIPMQHAWNGWWSKMEMFRPDIEGDFLYTDLDAVFMNGVPEWDLKETTVLSDMYGQPHINSGLMFIKHDDRALIWDAWIKSPEKHMTTFRGDQDFLDVFWRKKQRFQGVCNGEVVSYKADIVPKGFTGIERVVCFHGQPRPWDAANVELWIPKL